MSQSLSLLDLEPLHPVAPALPRFPRQNLDGGKDGHGTESVDGISHQKGMGEVLRQVCANGSRATLSRIAWKENDPDFALALLDTMISFDLTQLFHQGIYNQSSLTLWDGTVLAGPVVRC